MLLPLTSVQAVRKDFNLTGGEKMGRNNKRYHKNLCEQLYDRLTSMQAFGESKKQAKADGSIKEKIFSFQTYRTYLAQAKHFIDFLMEHHPEVVTLKTGRKYVPEYLQSLVDRGLSSWTIHTAAKSLGKVYGISPEDRDYYKPPIRARAEITRSRNAAIRDRNFSVTNNTELIDFSCGTGLRRSELKSLKGSDLKTLEQIENEIKRIEAIPEESRSPSEQTMLHICTETRIYKGRYPFFIHVRQGKGGRQRLAPIVGDRVKEIVERIQDTEPNVKVWQKIHGGADIHFYRSEYCKTVYQNACEGKDLSDFPLSDCYICRRDMAGKRYWKRALKECTHALGHNRLEVTIVYLRNLKN